MTFTLSCKNQLNSDAEETHAINPRYFYPHPSNECSFDTNVD